MTHALHRRRRAAQDERGARKHRELECRVARLQPGRPVALVRGVVLLVDDHEAHVREGREERGARPDHDVRLARADPAPLVGALALPEPRVEDPDPHREVGTQPVDDRRRERDLGDQQQRRATRRQAGGDRLDVDRGLAAPGDAVEQGRRRVAPLESREDDRERLGLGVGEARLGRPRAADARGPAKQRPARTLPDFRAQEAAPDEAGDGRGAVALGERGCRRAVGSVRGHRLAGHLVQRGNLARSERPAGEALAGGEPRVRRRPVGGQPQPSLVARTHGGDQQRPGEVDEARVGERPQPPQERRATLGRGQVAHGTRTPGELVEQVQLHGRQVGIRLTQTRLPGRRHLGDQLQPLEHARRQHRPDHRRQRREIPVGDEGSEAERERRQEGAIAAHASGNRSDLAALGRGRRPGTNDDADRLAAALAERHEDGLAGLKGTERGRGQVRVGPRTGPGRRVDRDLDQHVVVVATDGQLQRGGHGRRPAQMIRIRRSPRRRFSCATIAWISAAVRSISPVSLTTTWS